MEPASGGSSRGEQGEAKAKARGGKGARRAGRGELWERKRFNLGMRGQLSALISGRPVPIQSRRGSRDFLWPIWRAIFTLIPRPHQQSRSSSMNGHTGKFSASTTSTQPNVQLSVGVTRASRLETKGKDFYPNSKWSLLVCSSSSRFRFAGHQREVA